MFRLIAAIDNNYAIGYNNKLLFNDSIDKAFFKEKTSGGIVIMGRTTFQTLPDLLEERENYVVTHNPEQYENKSGLYFGNLNQCLRTIYDLPDEERKNVWVIGGEKIYSALLNRCREAYLTHIDTEYPTADAYFPRIDKMDKWHMRDIIKEYKSLSGWSVKIEFWKRSK